MARHLGICPGQRVQTKQCRPKHQEVQRQLSQPLFHEVCSHQLFAMGTFAYGVAAWGWRRATKVACSGLARPCWTTASARQIALYQCCTEAALAPTGGVDKQQRVWFMKLPLIS
jgi:hypothetical protein